MHDYAMHMHDYAMHMHDYAMHMQEQYILQPTESSPGTRNPSPQRKRMAVWNGWHSSCWQYAF